MLKKTHRLAKSKDIKAVFARGRGFFNPYLTIKYRFNPEIKRFTVIVSTKVSKSAVKRNWFKRTLREYIRINFDGLNHGDYAVIVKPNASKLGKNELLSAFTQLIHNSKLIR